MAKSDKFTKCNANEITTGTSAGEVKFAVGQEFTLEADAYKATLDKLKDEDGNPVVAFYAKVVGMERYYPLAIFRVWKRANDEDREKIAKASDLMRGMVDAMDDAERFALVAGKTVVVKEVIKAQGRDYARERRYDPKRDKSASEIRKALQDAGSTATCDDLGHIWSERQFYVFDVK